MENHSSNHSHDSLKKIFFELYKSNPEFHNYANQENSKNKTEIKSEHTTYAYIFLPNFDTHIINVFILATYFILMDNKLRQLKKDGGIYFDIALLAPFTITLLLYEHTRNTLRHGTPYITDLYNSFTKSPANLLWDNDQAIGVLCNFIGKQSGENISESISCPVSGNIMSQPCHIVKTTSGDKKYMDLSSLQQWVDQQSFIAKTIIGKPYRCPVTNEIIPDDILTKLKEDPTSLIDSEKQKEILETVLSKLESMDPKQEQEHETGVEVERPKLA